MHGLEYYGRQAEREGSPRCASTADPRQPCTCHEGSPARAALGPQGLADLVEHKARTEFERIETERVRLSAQSWALSEGLRKVREARLTGSPAQEAWALQDLVKLV